MAGLAVSAHTIATAPAAERGKVAKHEAVDFASGLIGSELAVGLLGVAVALHGLGGQMKVATTLRGKAARMVIGPSDTEGSVASHALRAAAQSMGMDRQAKTRSCSAMPTAQTWRRAGAFGPTAVHFRGTARWSIRRTSSGWVAPRSTGR